MDDLSLNKLYDNYSVLSQAKDKISEHSKEYLEAIEATKGSVKLKGLAIQIISKFSNSFLSLKDQGLEAIINTCEDDDGSIRIAAMKALPMFCRGSKEYVTKVADILAQLLQLEEPQEYNTASNTLLQVIKENPLVAIKCIFRQIKMQKTFRKRSIQFLVSKIKTLDKSVLTTEVDDLIITQTKELLKDATAEEFISLMPFLAATRLGSTFLGQQELIDMSAEQAELDEDFDPLDKENNTIDRLLTCIKFIMPFFSVKVDPKKFVVYICDQVLPQWSKIGELEEGELLQLAVLRQLAEMSTHCGKLDNPSATVVHIYSKLKDYMPPPPEDADVNTMPLLDFTSVECLLYAFHKLARQCPDFLTHDPQELKDFRARLLYFSRGVQGCSKALNNTSKTPDETLTPDDAKKKKLSPKICSNINTLIKDLFYQPPIYKCNVVLSFKAAEKEQKISPEKQPVTPTKRHVPITFESNGAATGSSKQPRVQRSSDGGVKLYTPPSGKFSNSFQSYGGRSRGRSGRGGRGRSSGRGWRN